MSTPALPVEVVCTSGPVPIVAGGRAFFADGLYTIHLDSDVSLAPVGGRAILSFASPDVPRIIARVESAHGNQMVCLPEQHRNRERRDFPRMHAGLPLRLRRLAVTERAAESDAWLRGEPGPAERGEWWDPTDIVDFSVTGVRVAVDDSVEEGDSLLIELGVPGSTERWRGMGTVVRMFRDPDATSAAIEFSQIPDEAHAALSDLTLQIQDEMITGEIAI